jgi:cytochrome c peroxidase
MVLDGSQDKIESPPVNGPGEDGDADGVTNEVDTALIDHLEFYLLNYFKPGTGRQTTRTQRGRAVIQQIGCTSCHVPDLGIDNDRRVADVETMYDEERGIFNSLFATASPRFVEDFDSPGHPAWKRPAGGSFMVRNIFTDFKRHDVGAAFYELEYNGEVRKEFLTTALWGVGSTPPYGHDGRSMTLRDVILRHGGEAQASRDRFAKLSEQDANALVEFLNSLVLFPPDDTASNLDPGDPAGAMFPQNGHGSIKLTVLFNDPGDPE